MGGADRLSLPPMMSFLLGRLWTVCLLSRTEYMHSIKGIAHEASVRVSPTIQDGKGLHL